MELEKGRHTAGGAAVVAPQRLRARTFRSLEALPASSSTSAVRYSAQGGGTQRAASMHKAQHAAMPCGPDGRTQDGSAVHRGGGADAAAGGGAGLGGAGSQCRAQVQRGFPG